jgi:hypothetical protein
MGDTNGLVPLHHAPDCMPARSAGRWGPLNGTLALALAVGGTGLERFKGIASTDIHIWSLKHSRHPTTVSLRCQCSTHGINTRSTSFMHMFRGAQIAKINRSRQELSGLRAALSL